MAMVSAGRILILPKGTWDNLASYDMLDMVTASNNKAYLARKASVGVNPTTDDGTYWQMFGSSVAADGTTIVDDGSGNISVNIDNDTIKYDSTNGYLYVDIDPDKALEDLTDVAITSATNGQALIFDSVVGKWKNGSITSSVSTLTDVNLTNLADGEILKYDANSGKFVNAPETSGGHTYINDNEVTMAQRSKAQFKDLDVTDDSANDKTIISATNKADKTDLTSISETGSTASQAISAGQYFYLNGSLVRAKTDIASGATFVSGTNYEVVTVGGQLSALNSNLSTLNTRIDSNVKIKHVDISMGKSDTVNFNMHAFLCIGRLGQEFVGVVQYDGAIIDLSPSTHSNIQVTVTNKVITIRNQAGFAIHGFILTV